MALLEQSKTRYLRSPRLTLRPEGVTLHLVAWEEGGERILRVPLDRAGEVSGAIEEGPLVPAIPALDHARPPGVAASSAVELEARDAGERVLAVHEDGRSRIVLERASSSIPVFEAVGMATAPALARAPRGTWVAFHHDVREDTRIADVAKWIAVRFVDDEGVVHEPSAPMTGRDRDLAGVEQSFEFPSLVVGSDGALAIFGRGSHDFFRQDLSAAGFGERRSLSDGEWGSRGRRIVALRLDDGGVLAARRDRKGIVVDRQDEPSGGFPALVRADVDYTARARVERPALDRTRDPAARHGLATFFGDIQQHSAHSDGVGSADEAYLRARYRYGDDFVALTDHESFLGKRTGPGEWAFLEDVADRHDAPGRFATLIAYEWTGVRHPGPGHKCVYLPRRGLALVSRDDVPKGRDLVSRIRALGGIASPHHIGWTGCDEEGHDPEGQPVWEICSCHGCYEHADHPLGQRGEHRDQLVDVMLAKGHRFGFTASSDSHGLLWHHGESRKRDPYRTGLTAVQAAACTRDLVLEALRARRCYATSGAKILLDVTVEGQPMGSILRRSGPVTVEVRAVGEGPLARVELVGPGGVLFRSEASGREHELRTELTAPYVYARVVQADGEMAWSSPVFVDPA